MEKKPQEVRQQECEFGHSGQSVPRRASSPQPLQPVDAVSVPHNDRDPHFSLPNRAVLLWKLLPTHTMLLSESLQLGNALIGCNTTYRSVIYLLQSSGLMLVRMLALHLLVFFFFFFFFKGFSWFALPAPRYTHCSNPRGTKRIRH